MFSGGSKENIAKDSVNNKKNHLRAIPWYLFQKFFEIEIEWF